MSPRIEVVHNLDKFAADNFIKPFGVPGSNNYDVRSEHQIDYAWALIKKYPEWAAQGMNRARHIWPQGKGIEFPTYISHPFVPWFLDELHKGG